MPTRVARPPSFWSDTRWVDLLPKWRPQNRVYRTVRVAPAAVRIAQCASLTRRLVPHHCQVWSGQ